MSQWIHESMNNESMNEGMDEWMDGWASSFALLSYFFTERPLCWGTSSLSYIFSGQPLLSATCALSCLPASCFVALHPKCSYNGFSSLQLHSRTAQELHMVKSNRSRSRCCYNAFGNLQRQSCLSGGSQCHWCSPAHSRANALCHNPVQTHSRSAAPNQGSRRADNRDDSAQLLEWRAFTILILNRALAAVLCTFCRWLSQIEARNRGNRDRDYGSHFTLKTTGFSARECFHPWIHAFPNCYTSQNYLMMGGWHDDVGDMMMEMLTMTIVRNSEAF